MLALFGADYVIDHVVAEVKRQDEDRAYRVYVTDALRAIVNNSAQVASKEQVYMSLNDRWFDIISMRDVNREVKDDPRNCKEIVTDMWRRIRGKGDK